MIVEERQALGSAGLCPRTLPSLDIAETKQNRIGRREYRPPEAIQRLSGPHLDSGKDERQNSGEPNDPKLFPHHAPGWRAGLGESLWRRFRWRGSHRLILQCRFPADRV